MALPCAGWGKACRRKPSDAPPGLACARACVRILLVVRECSIFFSIENPRASELRSWGPLVKELQKFDASTVDHIDTDYCTHGTPYRKSTRFVTNLPHLRSHIGTRCSCSAPHVPLSGTCCVFRPDGSKRSAWLTSFSAAYPPQLALKYARALALSAPSDAYSSDRRCDQRDREQLVHHLASRTDAQRPVVRAPRCPRRLVVGWEVALPTWGVPDFRGRRWDPRRELLPGAALRGCRSTASREAAAAKWHRDREFQVAFSPDGRGDFCSRTPRRRRKHGEASTPPCSGASDDAAPRRRCRRGARGRGAAARRRRGPAGLEAQQGAEARPAASGAGGGVSSQDLGSQPRPPPR